MFKSKSDGNSVQVSMRTNDGANLIGAINLGSALKLESLLASDIKFIEFISRDGQQRFIAHHQIASVELMTSVGEPALPAPAEDAEPFSVLGIEDSASLEEAMAAFQTRLQAYSPERWTGPDIPFEFCRFAVQKTRQLNTAFTAVKAMLQAKAPLPVAKPPPSNPPSVFFTKPAA